MMTLYYLMPIIFIIGIIAIALEDTLKINKAAVALGMCILLWSILFMDVVGVFEINPPKYLQNFILAFPQLADLPESQLAYKFIEIKVIEALGDVSTTLFFVLASMAIIEVLDSHRAFSAITNSIKTTNQRKLLWIISFITFFLSALLGNLATVIVIIAVLRKLIPDRSVRLTFSCMTILAANAGGSWSPIGDVTTLILWTGGNISALHQVSHLFLSSLTMMLVPLSILTFTTPKGSQIIRDNIDTSENLPEYVTPKFQKILLWIGLLSLACVPVLQSLFDLPPFMGVILGLVLLWVITDIKSAASHHERSDLLKVSNLFSKVDISTVLFFLGILMSVQALNYGGFLTMMSEGLNKIISDSSVIALLLGICSSFLDNVALVAATMGMYPVAEAGAFMADSSFWTFLAYCAVTGGSILIIGSASGVTVMGMEKISFGYYLKKFTILALLGYCSGAVVYLLLF